MAGQGRSAKAPEKRTYTLRQRRASMDETRARILDAAIELYETAGPSGTSMSAAAERAGVTRATLYRHFRSDAELAEAVLAEWLATAPPVDTAAIVALAGSPARLRHALDDLYGWYRATEAVTANLLRDAHLLPANRQRDLRAAAAHVGDAVRGGRGSGEGGPLSDAVLNHAVAFETWRSLSAQGLDDGAIAELMEQFLVAAAAVPDRGKKAAGVRRVRNAASAVTTPEPLRAPAAAAAPARAAGRSSTRADTPAAVRSAATPATRRTIATPAERTGDGEPARSDITPATPKGRAAMKPAPPAPTATTPTAATTDASSIHAAADRTKKAKGAKSGKGKAKAGKKGKGERKARERDSASR